MNKQTMLNLSFHGGITTRRMDIYTRIECAQFVHCRGKQVCQIMYYYNTIECE